MTWMLLQLSLCAVFIIQLTSSQSTYDANQQENEVCSGDQTEKVLRELLTAVSQLQASNSQLQREVAEIKAAVVHKDVTGKLYY